MSLLKRDLQYYLKRARYRSNGWNFSRFRRGMYVEGKTGEWKKYYLPVNMKGLTVLDVGAGEGETARFFLERGAAKVLCIECDTQAFNRLKQNAVGRPIQPFYKRFSLEDLKLPFDFMKMDIEGYEEALLDVDFQKPCVVEVHGLQLRDKFERKGYLIKSSELHGSVHCCAFAYGNC